MSGVGIGRWERGVNRAPLKNKERSAESALKLLDRRIAAMETRYQKMLDALREEGLDDRPFTRRDASLAFQVEPVKAGQYLLELKELGFVRKMRGEGFKGMWTFVREEDR